MLFTLNDDCLYLICKHLDVEDHISLSQTAERLSKIISSYYARQRKVTLDQKIWLKNDEQRQKFLATFGRHIGPYIKELSIKGIDVKQLDLLEQLPLGKIIALGLELSGLIEDSSKVKLDKYLSCLSVQLKELELRGNNFFHTFADHKFPNVTKLHVCDGIDHLKFTMEMFPALTHLQLYGLSVNWPSLSELKNLTALQFTFKFPQQENLQMIFRSPALKKLTFDTESVLRFDGISECQTLEELVVFASFWLPPLGELTHLKNLQRISVTGAFKLLFEHPYAVCKYLNLPKPEVLDLSNVNFATKLKNLKHLKIYLPYNEIIIDESYCNALIEILRNCHNLCLFEICSSEFYAFEILKRMLQVSQDIYGGRKKILSIVCAIKQQDGLNEHQQIKSLSFPRFMKLSFEDYYRFCYLYPQLQCDWKVKSG